MDGGPIFTVDLEGWQRLIALGLNYLYYFKSYLKDLKDLQLCDNCVHAVFCCGHIEWHFELAQCHRSTCLEDSCLLVSTISNVKQKGKVNY